METLNGDNGRDELVTDDIFALPGTRGSTHLTGRLVFQAGDR